MSTGETPKKISTSEVYFLCKEKVPSEEKIKVFGKSTLDPAFNGSRSVLLRRERSFAAPNVIIVMLRYKRALDRVAENRK